MSEGSVEYRVGKTALGMAMVRAEESRREDRLFDDPYAQAFVDAAPAAFDTEQSAAATRAGDVAASFWSHAVLRTRFFDDYLLDAARAGIRQVVLLVAGLDTRGYRLAWPPGTRLFELDLPGVLNFKQRILDEQAAVPGCARVSVPADLGGSWATKLLAADFDPGQATGWLAEGLLIYLSAVEAAQLLSTITELSAAGSRLAFEHEILGTDAMRRQARAKPAMQQYVSMWKGGLPDASSWLATHGWQPEFHDRAVVAADIGRAVSKPFYGGFLTATRN